jgi:hypothetical protein
MNAHDTYNLLVDIYLEHTEELEAERDEARAIAGELARYIKTNPPSYPLYSTEAKAWFGIRPGVRKWLEGK